MVTSHHTITSDDVNRNSIYGEVNGELWIDTSWWSSLYDDNQSILLFDMVNSTNTVPKNMYRVYHG